MGRGYSATRANSSRSIRKTDRNRSLSVAKLQSAIEAKRDLDEISDVSEEDSARISDAEVLTKYKAAGQIVDEALNLVSAACVEGASTYSLCCLGNQEVVKRAEAKYKRSKNAEGERILRGIAFPTNVSVNEVVANHAPSCEEEAVTLRRGDVVKVHLGCHIDGYSAQAARTVVVGEADNSAVTDCVAATVCALATMVSLVRPGAHNSTVTDAIEHIGNHFGASICEGVLSHRMKRWVLDGNECIIAKRVVRTEPQQDVADVEFHPFQVWALDVAFTTASTHKLQPTDDPVSIYRKNEVQENVRVDAAAFVLSQCKQVFGCFPFTAGQTANPLKAKLGIRSLQPLQVLDTFPALRSKGGITTRASCTVAVTDKRIHVLCGEPNVQLGASSIKGTPPSIAPLLALPRTLEVEEEADAAPKNKRARR